MNAVDDLLHAPIGATEGPEMDAKEYREKHSATSIKEINRLIDQYWEQRGEVQRAWEAPPEEIRDLPAPPGD
jgi:hypothetical protein